MSTVRVETFNADNLLRLDRHRRCAPEAKTNGLLPEADLKMK